MWLSVNSGLLSVNFNVKVMRLLSVNLDVKGFLLRSVKGEVNPRRVQPLDGILASKMRILILMM